MKWLWILLCSCVAATAETATPQMPIPNNYADSIKTRWLGKPVLDSRLLDDAESLQTWAVTNMDQARGELTLTKERAVTGVSAVRLRSATTGDKPVPTSRYYGTTAALRVVNGEDWSDWNRLSFWVYPDWPGFRTVSMMVTFHNAGSEHVPDVYGKMGVNYVVLRNHEWNHVVWEIANLTRDKVTGVEFAYRMQGNEPGASGTVTFDIDDIELQKVNADHFEGWNVAPGEISFSHSGYSQGSPKSAIASDLTAREFQLVNVESGNTVLTKPVRSMETQIGKFQVMDFSEVTEPGTYVIHAGNRATRPFRIGDDVWKSSLWKALNFFYVERCGYAVPGVHDICHRDWLLLHGDQKLVVNGGWHDAGDLSQSLMNTAEADYAMFSLAEQLQTRADDPALMARLLDEAKWGLDWILKTTFHDGFRPTFSMMDRWTDGIIGNVDDIVAEAGNSPDGNFAAAAAEAVAARVLRGTDPILAAHALKQAKEDWDFAMAGTSSTNSDRRRGNQTDLIGHAVLATLELWQTTGERPYADKAVELSRKIVDSQQRTFLTGLDYPLTGFFYTGPDKTRILRYSHVSHEEAPVTALVRLCELFPNDPAWMKWYSAVTLYSDYFQAAMARFTQPYGMLANSVYRDDEYLQVPEGRGRNGMTREAYRDQILNGVKVGEHYYVRLFPVWFGFRGNYGTVLSQTAALAAAAHLRGNFELAALAQQQLEWVVGRNPFVQSTMWGEGYDYAPQYTAMSGDIVGSLPVGIQSHRNADAPYWPAENCHNWKEVWVLPVGRWISLMRDLSGPAELSGTVETTSLKPVEILRAGSEKITTVVPDEKTGSFYVRLPEGRYEISSGAERRSLTLLPGGSYDVDLTPGAAIHLSLSQETRDNGEMVIRAELAGSGRHTLVLRSDNLSVDESERVIELKTGTLQKMEWRAKLESSDAPWVAVVLPDNNFSQRKELTGSVQQIGVFHSKTAVEKSHPVPAN